MEKMLKDQLGNLFRDMLIISILMLLFRFPFVDAMVVLFTMLLGRVMLLREKQKGMWCVGIVGWMLLLTICTYGFKIGFVYTGLMIFVAYGAKFLYQHKDWE